MGERFARTFFVLDSLFLPADNSEGPFTLVTEKQTTKKKDIRVIQKIYNGPTCQSIREEKPFLTARSTKKLKH